MEKIKQNVVVCKPLHTLCIKRKTFEEIIKNKLDIIFFYDYDESTKDLKKGDIVNLTLNSYDWDSEDGIPNLLIQIVSIGHFDYHNTIIVYTPDAAEGENVVSSSIGNTPVSLDVQVTVHTITGEKLDSTFEAIAKSLDNESKK